jgi:colanic acid biosynthesis glycosyl transferase WcaI
MRFLLLNQFYPPDGAPTGQYLHDLARELVARGHGVRVVCSRHAYGTAKDLGPGGVLDGVDVRRVRGAAFSPVSWLGRTVAHSLYFFQATASALLESPRPDLVLSATSPPFLGLAGAMARRWRGVPQAEWTMDVYPGVIHAHWAGRNPTWSPHILDALARFQLRRAALVLTLGTSMAARVARYVSDGTRIETVPLWSLLEANGSGSSDLRAVRGWPADGLVLLYSGNMGRGHRFGEFLEAARRLGQNGPIWAFVGSGPRRAEIERFRLEHPNARVQLLASVPSAEVAASLASADVHLVSLSRAWQGLIVPSKLQGAFGLGRPVLFVGAADNEIAAWIKESGGGWVVDEGDVEGVLRALEEAADPSERHRRGRLGREYAREHFDVVHNRGRVADLLEQCAMPRS